VLGVEFDVNQVSGAMKRGGRTEERIPERMGDHHMASDADSVQDSLLPELEIISRIPVKWRSFGVSKS
jgi:hypothetical protein